MGAASPTFPLALTTVGLALWLAGGGPQRHPSRTAQWLVGMGMAGMLVWFVVLLVK